MWSSVVYYYSNIVNPQKNWKRQTTLKRKQKHNNNGIMYFPANVFYSRGTTLSHLILSDDITYHSSQRMRGRHLTFELVPFTKLFSRNESELLSAIIAVLRLKMAFPAHKMKPHVLSFVPILLSNRRRSKSLPKPNPAKHQVQCHQ